MFCCVFQLPPTLLQGLSGALGIKSPRVVLYFPAKIYVRIARHRDAGRPHGLYGAVAELERSLIAERVRAGLRNARAKGKRLGRPRVALDATRIARFRSQGLSWAKIAKALDCGVGTAYRASAKCPKTRDSLAGTCHASGQGIAALTR